MLRSLRGLLLTYELALLLLVIVTGALGGLSVYFWREASTESLRLSRLTHIMHHVRSDLFRQIREVTRARLMEEAAALALYSRYSRRIDDKFNALRQGSASRAEALAIQGMQRAYRVIQQDMNNIFGDPYAASQLGRMRILESHHEEQLVGGFETAFRAFDKLLTSERAVLDRRVGEWVRLTPVLIPLPILLAAVLVLLSRLSLQRRFVAPMARLIEGSRLLSAGALDHKLSAAGVEEVQQLALAINHMAAELATSRDALVERERQAALGALVPVIAHNIRNPLASIRASAQLLDCVEMREEIQEVKQAVIETVDRLGRWVTSLVSYLHPHKLNRTRARPSRMLATALGLLAAKITDKGLRLDERYRADEPEVWADADLMEQALFGLLSNAVDASPVGGRLTVATHGERDCLVLSINDEGPGMPFDPEADGLTPGPSTKRYGTGLGIPFAFKVCNAHGWKLAFSTNPAGGTRITIEVPLVGSGSIV